MKIRSLLFAAAFLAAAPALADTWSRTDAEALLKTWCDALVKHYWRGITVFSQTSLGKTLIAFGGELPQDLRAKWLARFRVQTDFLVGYFSKGLGDSNINYPITFCSPRRRRSRRTSLFRARRSMDAAPSPTSRRSSPRSVRGARASARTTTIRIGVR